MTYRHETFRTRTSMFAASDQMLHDAVQREGAVDLIVPTHVWEDQRKADLRLKVPLGVRVQTCAHWVEGLWELYGTGEPLVGRAERAVLLRPLVESCGLVDADPSAGLMDLLETFVAEAVVLDMDAFELTGSEQKVARLVDGYREALRRHGLVEASEAEQELAQRDFAGRTIVVEGAEPTSVHERRFLERVGRIACVVVYSRQLGSAGDLPADIPDELARVHAALFEGEQGVEPAGAVLAGVAQGAHIDGELLVALVRRMVEDGARLPDISVVFANAHDGYRRVRTALERAGIAHVARFSKPLDQSGLGAAYCDFMYFAERRDEDETYEFISEFLATPYSGLSGQSARAVQMRWRSLGHSTAADRLRDLQEGFSTGHGKRTEVAAQLAPVVELIQASPAQRARLMFEHACDGHLDADALVEDREAAERIVGYCERCEQLGTPPQLGDLKRMVFPAGRRFGDADDALALTDAGSLGFERVPYVLLADLDAAHYPMARTQGTLDVLREKLGVLLPDDTPHRQRIALLDLVEQASRGFAFYRDAHNADGTESCQSALWDELMTVYRSAADDGPDDAGVAVHEVPSLLRPYAVELSEAEVFFASDRGPVSEVSFARGVLERDAAVDLLTTRYDATPLVFSPTAIEAYYRCPYSWFSSRRLNFNGPDSSFDQLTIGNLAHDTLERFYRALHESGEVRVTPANLPFALELASRALDEQVEHTRDRAGTGLFLRTRADELRCEDLRSQLRAFVERDAAFLPGYAPAFFELKLGRGEAGPIEYAGVPVSGKVDRIDVNEQGQAVVIDYKLSSLGSGYGLQAAYGEDGSLPQRIQTDIYAALVERHFAQMGEPVEVVGSVYRSYARNNLRGVYDAQVDWGDAEHASPANDALPRAGGESYHAYLERVERVVAQRMEELHEGMIEPRPLAAGKSICAYCKAASFCPRKGV